MSNVRNPSKNDLAVYNMLKSGKPVTFANMVTALGCKEVSVMTYICALRNLFGADIETIRNGRKVEAYQLKNADEIASKMVVSARGSKTAAVKQPKAVKQKPVKAVKATKVTKVSKVAKVAKSKPKEDAFDIPTLDSDLDISEITDRELDDLKFQLGL